MYQLYYYPRNASFAPHLVLEELGLDFELVLVDRRRDAHKDESYLALNPAGRIPTLVHGNVVVFESAAICLYLCETSESGHLLPESGSPLRPRFYQWLFYLTTTLQAELMFYFYPDRHCSSATQAAAIAKAQDVRLVEMFALLDRELAGRDYLLGDEITICDCFLFMLAIWADELSTPPLNFASLRGYLQRLAKRPAFRRVCEKEGVNLAAYD